MKTNINHTKIIKINDIKKRIYPNLQKIYKLIIGNYSKQDSSRIGKLQERFTNTNGNSREEKEMRYENIIFLLESIDQTKPKRVILHKEKRLNNILLQIDMFWENHPNWSAHPKQTKTMGNLMHQLQNRGDEFMNCFPKTIFQNKTFNEPRLILLLADKGWNLEEINKIAKIMKAIIDIEETVRPIKIMLNWNKALQKIENQLN